MDQIFPYIIYWIQNLCLSCDLFDNSNLYNKGGKVIRHDTTSNKGGKMVSFNSRLLLTKDELFLLLYVDNGALIYTNRSDSILDLKIDFTQMKEWVWVCMSEKEEINQKQRLCFSHKEKLCKSG